MTMTLAQFNSPPTQALENLEGLGTVGRGSQCRPFHSHSICGRVPGRFISSTEPLCQVGGRKGKAAINPIRTACSKVLPGAMSPIAMSTSDTGILGVSWGNQFRSSDNDLQFWLSFKLETAMVLKNLCPLPLFASASWGPWTSLLQRKCQESEANSLHQKHAAFVSGVNQL